jgi:hypothetical protein
MTHLAADALYHVDRAQLAAEILLRRAEAEFPPLRREVGELLATIEEARAALAIPTWCRTNTDKRISVCPTDTAHEAR